MTILNPTKLSGTVTPMYANCNSDDESLVTQLIQRASMHFDGMQGDRHVGYVRPSDVRYGRQYAKGSPIRNTLQVTLLSTEELEEVRVEMGIDRLDAGWIGANLVITGIPDLTLLPPSTRLIFSSNAALVVDNENATCRYPGDEIDRYYPGKGKGFVKAAINRRGLVAWVEREGDIASEDSIAVHVPPLRIHPHV